MILLIVGTRMMTMMLLLWSWRRPGHHCCCVVFDAARVDKEKSAVCRVERGFVPATAVPLQIPRIAQNDRGSW